MARVFVSHSSDDNAEVAAIVAAIRQQSAHEVWVDLGDLRAAASIDGAIADAVDDSEAFLLLWSWAARKSRYVKSEWGVAFDRGAHDESYKLLVGHLDDCKPPSLSNNLKRVYFTGNHEAAITEVIAALDAIDAERQDRPAVWFYDDEERWLERFTDAHRRSFEITTFDEPGKLLKALLAARKRGTQPDIILSDLYSLRDGIPPELRGDASRCSTTILSAERDLREYVNAAWHPGGVDIVETVREVYSPRDLPIAMHTQQGLVLLQDELIQRLESYGVGWVIKNRFSPDIDRLVLERVARRSGRPFANDKPHVLIIDDNPAFIESFIARQADAYTITSLTRESEVMSTVARLAREGRPVDLFLVDMYYPKGGEGSAERIAEANAKLREFAELEHQLQAYTHKCFEPVGLTLVKHIAAMPDAPPVIIYSQSGLFTVGDDHYREIERLGASWILKDRHEASTEEILILGQMSRATWSSPSSTSR